ncbi:MAG: methyltransferase domain-containing protein [Pseudomonadota bacterium]
MTAWFSSSLGSEALIREAELCRQLLPTGYYRYSVQLGLPAVSFAADVEVGHRFLVDRSVDALAAAHHSGVVSRSGALPFAEKSIDLLYLPHTLDFCNDPHEVLREASQVLIPEGCVVLTGFNLVSLWGGLKHIRPARWRKVDTPYCGRYYRVGGMQDWLSLLGFDVVGAQIIGFQPPVQNEQWRRRLGFLEKAGSRWWPGLGAIWLIVGRKREVAVSGGNKNRLRWQQLIPGIAGTANQPAARHAARTTLHLVPK